MTSDTRVVLITGGGRGIGGPKTSGLADVRIAPERDHVTAGDQQRSKEDLCKRVRLLYPPTLLVGDCVPAQTRVTQ